MNLRRIESDVDPAYALAISLYEDAFVPDERVDSGTVRRRLTDGSRYELVEIVHDDAFAGFAMMDWYEIEAGCLLGGVLYLAVLPERRGRGLGKQVYKLLFERILERCRKENMKSAGMIYEVERPELAVDEEDRALRQRRLDFYIRMGGRVLEGIDYVQPSLGEGKEPVRLHLMHHAAPNMPRLSDADLHRLFMRHAWGQDRHS
jgi:GNAT superfamily N-acetyltransferase